MRILILHNFYQHLGGEDTVVQQEADALTKRGHQVKIINTKNNKGIIGLKQYLTYPYNCITANSLLKKIDKEKPEIIHIHNLHYAIGPLIIRKLKQKGYPVVMTLHNFRLICPSATLFYRGKLFSRSLREDFPWSAVKNKVLENSFIKTTITGFTYWLHKKIGTWNLVDKYFTFSQFSKDIFKSSTIGIAADKYIIKPNFVNASTLKEKIFEDYFIYIGRLSEEKGIIPLLEAFSKTKYTLKIFGTGPQENLVTQFANLHPNIQYLGFQSKDILNKEISLANALIVPSVCYEGMPMTIIEAFAQGTPVLCSNIGILEQMIVPLQTGLHFDPNSPETIAKTLDIWNSLDGHTKNTISNNCIDEYLNKYTEERNLSLLEDVYQQTIKK